MRSLTWSDDTLVDIAGGMRVFRLDGSCEQATINYAYSRFDSALISPCRQYALLYELLGTKCLVLKGREIIRQVNRSFYHADDYEYPITFVTLPGGTTAIAHCPDSYNRIEIDEVESGNRLTKRDSPPASSMFHSRLSASADGKYLMSAGWVWHPKSQLWLYDLDEVMQRPATLDATPIALYENWRLPDFEIDSAAFEPEARVTFATLDDDDVEEEPDENPRSEYSRAGGRKHLYRYDLKTKEVVSASPLNQPAGTLMPMGDQAVTFDQYPRLIEVDTGECLSEWPELRTGNRSYSIRKSAPPPVAIDQSRHRFAVASADSITVIELAESVATE